MVLVVIICCIKMCLKLWKPAREVLVTLCTLCTPAPHVKLAYIDVLSSTINVRLLHRGTPPRSSLKRRNATESLPLFTFQKCPVTPDPRQRPNRFGSFFSSNLSLLHGGGKNKVFEAY